MKKQPEKRSEDATDAQVFAQTVGDSIAALSMLVHEMRATMMGDTLDLRARMHGLARRLDALEQAAAPADTRVKTKPSRGETKAVESRKQLAQELKAKREPPAENGTGGDGASAQLPGEPNEK